jgi:hypothetical protein
MLLVFLGMPSFLGFPIIPKHCLREGHTLITPNFFVGLLKIKWLSHGCAKGLIIFVIAIAFTSVVCLVGAAMGFAMLANFSLCAFLGTQSLEPPEAFFLVLLLVLGLDAVA